jgi:hypothetical protein
MELLSFINTNIGIAAVRRHDRAENMYFTQVWFRSEPGEWKQYHFYSRENVREISSGLLEAIYQSQLDNAGLSCEDWW